MVHPQVLTPPDAPVVALRPEDYERLDGARVNGLAQSTRRVYTSQWRNWCGWANVRGIPEAPAHPQMVRAYLAERAETKVTVTTLRVATAAIAYAHSLLEMPNPIDDTVRRTLKELAHQHRYAQKQVRGLTESGLSAVRIAVMQPRRKQYGHMETVEEARRRGQMDIAMLSLMRDGLLRVNEAASLTWEDLAEEADGSGRLHIRHSKTDQEGVGAVLYVSPETVESVKAIKGAACDTDSLFGLSARQITRRIKMAAEAAGLGSDFSGHSARVGMAQDLVRYGTELTALMNAGRWKSHEMPAHYTRNEEAGRGAVARFYGAA